MRGAALADLHLGFRAFPAVKDGRNVREMDTEEAWFDAVAAIVLHKPQLVTIAGDVFHHPRVSDYAKKAFLTGIRSILGGTNATIIVAQGNHDAGRTSDVLTPIALGDGWDARVFIVTEPLRILLKPGDAGWMHNFGAGVACFPFVVGGGDVTYKLDPMDGVDVNVLLLHAAVKGSGEGDRLPYFYGSADQALDIGREASRWDVIACGDFHEFTRLHPERLAFYSGSLERTSSNIWAESAPKGVVFYDTDTGKMELAPVANRSMETWDLGDFAFPPGSPAHDVNTCLDKLWKNHDIKDALVRFKVDAFPRSDREHIDWSLVRKIKEVATHFYLDIRYAAPDLGELDARKAGEPISLAEEAARFFREDPEDVRNLAVHYLDLEAEVEDAEEVDA